MPPKTKRVKRRLPKTRKMRNKREKKDDRIVVVLMEMLNLVKIYHWKTHSYAQHKATDELYERLNGHIDKFVEVLSGKDSSRIRLASNRIDLVDSSNEFVFKERIHEYREFLMDFNIYFNGRRDSDLLSIRDDILADLNQFLYLMTFK